jgi:SH3-like domain-containing protein
VTATAAAPTAAVCVVRTGYDGGTVNLRACPGAMCGAVLDILTEGERLTVLTAGNWTRAATKDGVTGWLNSKYCKGK